MATGMEINHIAIPAPMDSKGEYRFEREILGRNGMGIDVEGMAATVTWRWAEMSKTDFTWWHTFLLSGLSSYAFAHAKLFDQAQSLATYTYCIVHRPTYERIVAGAYVGVTLEISHIQ